MALAPAPSSITGRTELYEGRRLSVTVHGNPEDPEAAKALARWIAEAVRSFKPPRGGEHG